MTKIRDSRDCNGGCAGRARCYVCRAEECVLHKLSILYHAPAVVAERVLRPYVDLGYRYRAIQDTRSYPWWPRDTQGKTHTSLYVCKDCLDEV